MFFSAFVEYNPKTQTNCVMLTLVPKFSLNTIASELIFVVDRYNIVQIMCDVQCIKKFSV